MRNNTDKKEDTDYKSLFMLMSAMAEYESSNDPIRKDQLVEEIRNLKKQLVKLMEPFKDVECVVAGDKDAEEATVVLCADATPNAFRVDGTIEVPCSVCGITVILSPDSPKAPPKMCFKCATNHIKQSQEGESQDSLSA